MARYKIVDRSPRFLPVVLEAQLMSGSDKCLRTPDKTKTRQVSFFQGKADGSESFTDKMKARIDSPEG